MYRMFQNSRVVATWITLISMVLTIRDGPYAVEYNTTFMRLLRSVTECHVQSYKVQIIKGVARREFGGRTLSFLYRVHGFKDYPTRAFPPSVRYNTDTAIEWFTYSLFCRGILKGNICGGP